MNTKDKTKALQGKLDEITALTGIIEEEKDGKRDGDTPENREKLTALLAESETIRKAIEQDNTILGLKTFLTEPDGKTPLGSDGVISQPFEAAKSFGEQFVESEAYKSVIRDGKVATFGKFGVDLKGSLFPSGPAGRKATFTTTATGLDSTVNYANTGGIILVEQQKPTIRDLMNVGQTSMNAVPFIKETSFTNAAGMVAEEGEKPEATLATDDASAPVKKIAVVIKVADEVFADFPMMRDYVNSRLRDMVVLKEDNQLLNGTGSGAQITGILQTSGIQTQAQGSDTNADAIHKAITKVRSVGFFEPDALVCHPTDWQLLRLAKDEHLQYYGGGPFTGIAGDSYWGLKVVVTTAIAAGTALVGAFRLGAMIWQREGVKVEAFDQNEDDVNFNRITVRVEERLALTVYRPLAFCTVTSID